MAHTKMMRNKYLTAQVASYLKLPHPHIIDGDNWLDRRLVVGWRWGQRHLTHNLPRQKLGKNMHTAHQE